MNTIDYSLLADAVEKQADASLGDESTVWLSKRACRSVSRLIWLHFVQCSALKINEIADEDGVGYMHVSRETEQRLNGVSALLKTPIGVEKAPANYTDCL